MNPVFLIASYILFFVSSCNTAVTEPEFAARKAELPAPPGTTKKYTAPFSSEVRVKNYFSTMDSIISRYDSTMGYALTEHILVHANPWIIDSLMSFDYYRMKAKGIFVEDQKECVIFHRNDSLLIPDKALADSIVNKLVHTRLDINIPEFKLRIVEFEDTLFTFSVRVGMNKRRFLALAGREVDLQTHRGEGKIIRIEKNALYINPVDGHRYFRTRRDDGFYTMLPIIPWLEPEINGIRMGQLIHPTTNPETLGKAYSNGCIGTHEADAWRIYYHAPLGTKVIIRYDLAIVGEKGDTLLLKDIYNIAPAIQ